jgi:8-oxo-dGTP pyrophosphatase MutT (NUDIX family)
LSSSRDIGKIYRGLETLDSEPKFVEREHLLVEGLHPAGVLIPFVERDGELGLIFVKRADHLSRHAGEIAFPGGRREQLDRSLEQTALREANEEIGLDPTNVKLFGSLAKIPVISGFELNAFVGRLLEDTELYPGDSEVQRVLFVPLEALLEEAAWRTENREWRGEEFKLHFFDHEGDVIWGATARLVDFLLKLLRERHQDVRELL